MTKFTANYIGFSSSLSDDTRKTGNKGIWSLSQQFFYNVRNNWLGSFISARGGTETFLTGNDGVSYKMHTYTSPGPFNIISASGTVEVYIEAVGGGGAGGGAYGAISAGGSGGAGGGVYAKWDVTTASPFTISVGDAGTPQPGPSTRGSPGGPGGPTSIIGPGSQTIMNCGGGGGGGGGGGYGAPVAGGGAGGGVSVGPEVTTSIEVTSRSGTPAALGSGSGAPPAFNVVNGVGINTSSNLLYPVPSPITQLSRGGGAGQSSGANGSPGTAGHLRIFYRTDSIDPQNN
jgi:hypothetical protein